MTWILFKDYTKCRSEQRFAVVDIRGGPRRRGARLFRVPPGPTRGARPSRTSWPGLSRPPTPGPSAASPTGVDARNARGHVGREGAEPVSVEGRRPDKGKKKWDFFLYSLAAGLAQPLVTG